MEQVSSNSKSQAGAMSDAAALKADYIANGYILKLFKSGWNPTDLNVAADFAAHEADFTGYSSQAIGGVGFLFSAVGIDAEGNVVFNTPAIYRQATDAVAPNQVGGYWVESTGGVVRSFSLFAQPADLTVALSFILTQIFIDGNGEGYASIEN